MDNYVPHKTVHMFDFADWLWNNITNGAQPKSRYLRSNGGLRMSQTGKIEVDNVWTNSYNRKTNWQQAFEEGNNRPKGYGRGYIEWD